MQEFLSEFDLNHPAPVHLIEEAEKNLSFSFPKDYRRFLELGNGGDGFIGESYAILWRVEELASLNNEYQVCDYAPGLLLFGSNGGGEAFAFDLRAPTQPIVKVPFVGMDLQSIVVIGKNFSNFLNYLYTES